MAEAYVNFLGGSPLNRLSWLRSSPQFLKAIVHAPATRWILFNAGQPLIATSAAGGRSLARLTTGNVRPLLGSEPFFGQGQTDGAEAPSDVRVLEAARLRGPTIVFLGLQEPSAAKSSEGSGALPSSEFSAKSGDAKAVAEKVQGTPFFSLDVTDIEPERVDEVLRASEKAEGEGVSLQFTESRGAMAGMDAFEAAVFAEARSMTDWNSRNKFCPACGSVVYSMWAGWKLSCTSLLPWADNSNRQPCPTGKGLHNFAHPRSDPVVIMIAIDESGDKILLGRNKKFPGKFYSALAGFMEPGESFEDAVKREMWEEAGVSVWNVRYHSGQPWPFPANLMVGFYATADPSQPIRTDLDNELEDARWYTRAEILAVLAHPLGTNLTRRDARTLNAIIEGKDVPKDKNAHHPQPATAGAGPLAPAEPGTQARAEPAEAQGDENSPPFVVPPLTAIAGVLIHEWAHGKIGPAVEAKKGNL